MEHILFMVIDRERLPIVMIYGVFQNDIEYCISVVKSAVGL